VQSNVTGTPSSHPTAAVKPQRGQVSQVIRSLATSLPGRHVNSGEAVPPTPGSSQAPPAQRNRRTRTRGTGTQPPGAEMAGNDQEMSSDRVGTVLMVVGDVRAV